MEAVDIGVVVVRGEGGQHELQVELILGWGVIEAHRKMPLELWESR